MKKKIDATHKEFCDWLFAEIKQRAEDRTDGWDHDGAIILYDLGEAIATKLQEEYTKETSAQNNFNEDQIGINLAHFTLIKEIHKTLIIGFCVFIIFSLATWGYLLYNLLNH